MLESYSGTLSEHEAKQVLAEAGIPVVDGYLAADADEAVDHAEDLGFPVILKADSPDIQHKSDIGAVMDAHTVDEVRQRYDRIMENVAAEQPDADVNGVRVEEQADGVELIVGVHEDPDFGHVIMFGLGGVFVEVLHDVHFRAVPLTGYDARELVAGMETHELLEDVRGRGAVDEEAVVEVLLTVSAFVEQHPDVVEMDINPLFASPDGVVAADALLEVGDDGQ